MFFINEFLVGFLLEQEILFDRFLQGYDVCNELRRKPETYIVPILMVSAKARQEDRNIGLKLGADDYVSKPADPMVIMDKIRTLLANTN